MRPHHVLKAIVNRPKSEQECSLCHRSARRLTKHVDRYGSRLELCSDCMRIQLPAQQTA